MDRQTDLNKYAYTNYVQTMMEAAGHAPTKEQMLASRGPFLKMIHDLNPTPVVASTLRFSPYMPISERTVTRSLGGKSFEVREYKTGDGLCLVINIPHLVVGFSPPEWEAAVKDFLTLDPPNLTLGTPLAEKQQSQITAMSLEPQK